MAIASFLGPLLGWVFREVVVKFAVLTAFYAVLSILIPKGIELVAPWVGGGVLSSAFAGIPSGVWWGLDMLSLGYGMPLLISAYITRFLIRRLPVIG